MCLCHPLCSHRGCPSTTIEYPKWVRRRRSFADFFIKDVYALLFSFPFLSDMISYSCTTSSSCIIFVHMTCSTYFALILFSSYSSTLRIIEWIHDCSSSSSSLVIPSCIRQSSGLYHLSHSYTVSSSSQRLQASFLKAHSHQSCASKYFSDVAWEQVKNWSSIHSWLNRRSSAVKTISSKRVDHQTLVNRSFEATQTAQRNAPSKVSLHFENKLPF